MATGARDSKGRGRGEGEGEGGAGGDAAGSCPSIATSVGASASIATTASIVTMGGASVSIAPDSPAPESPAGSARGSPPPSFERRKPEGSAEMGGTGGVGGSSDGAAGGEPGGVMRASRLDKGDRLESLLGTGLGGGNSLRERSFRTDAGALQEANPSMSFSQELAGAKPGEEANVLPPYLGTFTYRGMEAGMLKQNQDYACTAQPFAGIEGTSFFCVCDGHGVHGDDVSKEVLNSLVFELEEQFDTLLTDPGNTIADAFAAVNDHLREMVAEEVVEVNAHESGACCVLAFVSQGLLWAGGVGDCRAVLGTKHGENGELLAAVALSTDHKVDLPSEQARIESCGGYVRPSYEDEDGVFFPAKLQASESHRPPGLAVSRVFGDLDAQSLGVHATPELLSHALEKEDRYLVMASDGLWEFLGNEEVVQIVHRYHRNGKSAQEAARFIIAKAAVAWNKEEGDAYRDDITVIVVYLEGLVTELKTSARRSSILSLVGEEPEGK